MPKVVQSGVTTGEEKGQQAYLPTPFAAFTPAAPPDEPLDDLPDPPADPAPMAQSSVPDLAWLSLGKETLLACWNTPTERERLSRDLNQSSISRVGSKPALPKPIELNSHNNDVGGGWGLSVGFWTYFISPACTSLSCKSAASLGASMQTGLGTSMRDNVSGCSQHSKFQSQ